MFKKASLNKTIHHQELNWFKVIFQWQSSVIPAIIPRVVFCGFFGLFISVFHFYYLNVGLPILSSVVPSIVLGLLLVFRTNTAYERFWEGRKLWGALVNAIRNLARAILVSVQDNSVEQRQEKVAYSIHLKQLLLIYCLTLPFQLVTELHWLTAPIVSVIIFTVFGIEQIGIEIENPFGHDANDLPLENICKTIQINIEELINFSLYIR
jgi:predicted membrane chloride channel (bestrophin family)